MKPRFATTFCSVCLMRPLSFAASGMYLLNVMQTPAGSVTMRIKYALLVPHQQVCSVVN